MEGDLESYLQAVRGSLVTKLKSSTTARQSSTQQWLKTSSSNPTPSTLPHKSTNDIKRNVSRVHRAGRKSHNNQEDSFDSVSMTSDRTHTSEHDLSKVKIVGGDMSSQLSSPTSSTSNTGFSNNDKHPLSKKEVYIPRVNDNSEDIIRNDDSWINASYDSDDNTDSDFNILQNNVYTVDELEAIPKSTKKLEQCDQSNNSDSSKTLDNISEIDKNISNTKASHMTRVFTVDELLSSNDVTVNESIISSVGESPVSSLRHHSDETDSEASELEEEIEYSMDDFEEVDEDNESEDLTKEDNESLDDDNDETKSQDAEFVNQTHPSPRQPNHLRKNTATQTDPISQDFPQPRQYRVPYYNRQYLDSTPLLPHVINADALEAVTAYSPAMIALHDLMKSQLNLTKNLIEQYRCLSESILSGSSPNYQYTTIDDTKQFIQQHKPKVLSHKEAMKLVRQEEKY